MVIAEKTVSRAGTVYTVRLSNLRQYATGVAAIDVSVRRVGRSAVIEDNEIRFSTPAGVSQAQSLPTPPSGEFATETVYLPAAGESATATWTGNYSTEPPQIEFSFAGLGGETIGPCSFTNQNGQIPQTTDGVEIGEIIQNAFWAGLLSQSEANQMVNAWFNDTVYEPCVGSGGDGRNGRSGGGRQEGISPAVVGLGVLGIGAVAVALAQQD